MLVSRLCSSWVTELEEDEIEEVEPKLSLACCRALAPTEFGEIAANWVNVLLAPELSPASNA